MIHPDTQLRHISQVVGHGVIATRLIPRGTITWVRDPLDQVLTPAQLEQLPAALREAAERYLFIGPDGLLILPWDLGRFVNHSCEPNCLSTGLGYEIAVRDIAAGEELTNDYANLGIYPEVCFACACAAPACRGEVRGTDGERLAPRWQAAITAALPLARAVPQPLGAWL